MIREMMENKKKQLQEDIDCQQRVVDQIEARLLIEKRDLNYMKSVKRQQINIPLMPRSIAKEEEE